MTFPSVLTSCRVNRSDRDEFAVGGKATDGLLSVSRVVLELWRGSVQVWTNERTFSDFQTEREFTFDGVLSGRGDGDYVVKAIA